jgi:hypothetical protein
MSHAAHRQIATRRRTLPQGALACCLVAGTAGLGPAALAQPEIYGHPDSSGFYLIPPDSDDWTRHFRLGPLAAFNIGAHFKISPGAFFNNVSGNNVAAGIYDDGYVRTDQTGNYGGVTSYWGYNNASSQYDSTANTITMHATTGYSVPNGSSAGGDVGYTVGFDLAYGVNIWYWKHARVGIDFGFSYLPISISDNSPMSATVNQTSYTFGFPGNVVPPGTVSSGSTGTGYQGGPSGVGPVINSTPSSTSQSTIGQVNVTGHRTLDANLFVIRLGPSMDWDLGEHVDMELSLGPALGIIDGEYSYNENVTVNGATAHNVGSFDKLGFQYGGYVSATFNFHLSDSVDIYLGGQFISMDDYTISNGGREASLDLGSQLYISAGFNWPF